MFAKIEVNGVGAAALYKWLKTEKPGDGGPDITWNFEKFLVGPGGEVLARWAPRTTPAEIGVALNTYR